MMMTLLGLIATSAAAQSEPPVRCEIRMTRWCIATFDGRIEMTEEAGERVWALQDRTEMRAGPLRIIEANECLAETTAPPAVPRLMSAKAEGEVLSETYQVGNAACKLEFRWPKTGANDPTYRQFVHFGVIIDPGTQPKQLNSAVR